MFKSFVKKIRTEHYILALILLVTVLLRFPGLGYSHFYGDETKTLYWDKRVPAKEFFFNQRKGPVQFFVVWTMEIITGGFGEFAVRLPFAVAGTLSVLVFYLILKRLFSKRVGYIGAFLFSINGFFIAFSRTAQYQSFLWLFGFLAILFADFAVKNKNKIFPLFSGVFLGLAFLSHYDAIFYAIPVAYILIKSWFKKGKLHINWDHIIFVGLPVLVIAGAFYIPYILSGNFENQTIGYLGRRMKSGGAIDSSLKTYLVYNPSIFNYLILAFAPLFLFSSYRSKAVILDLWFTAPMIVFEIIFSSSGTHIQNYVIPMIAMTGIGIDLVIEKLWINRIKFLLGGIIMIMFGGVMLSVFKIYLPYFNTNYPWKNKKLGNLEHSLYLYGFPYNRGWKKIGNYLDITGAHTFYTSDNVTIGEYYALGIYSKKVKPEYFVHVLNNQEFRDLNPEFRSVVFKDSTYQIEKEVFVNGEKTAQIYRRLN